MPSNYWQHKGRFCTSRPLFEAALQRPHSEQRCDCGSGTGPYPTIAPGDGAATALSSPVSPGAAMPIFLQRSALLLGPNLGYLRLMAPAQTLRASWTTCHTLCEKWAQILGGKIISLENTLQILNVFFLFFFFLVLMGSAWSCLRNPLVLRSSSRVCCHLASRFAIPYRGRFCSILCITNGICRIRRDVIINSVRMMLNMDWPERNKV